jgi:hypothetical protein
MRHIIVTLGLLAGILGTGCSMDDPTGPAVPKEATLLSVNPADAATGVSLDVGVTLTFSAPVDRELVQSHLHLISQWAIADSVCPDSATMHHDDFDMDHCMGDPEVMRHLDQHHATSGSYSWDRSGTVCTFHPGGGMTPSTEYMMHVGRDVADMGGHHGMMGNGDLVTRFTTMEQTR